MPGARNMLPPAVLEQLARFANNNMDEDAGRFLYPADVFDKTPSLQDGVSPQQELLYRQKLAMLMQNIGTKSSLTQLAVNTSVIYMHRFFMYRSCKRVPRVHIAIAFVFAAGKVEESARKLEHLIRTAIDIIRINKNRDFLDKNDEFLYKLDCEWRSKLEALFHTNFSVESSAYQEMRKIILDYEIEIYSTIGFHLQVVHPHNYVIRMCAMLGAENIKDISQYAYNLATASSQLTVMCLKYKPELIATVCLNIASRAHSIRFVNMKDPSVHWYQVHDPTMEWTVLESVTDEFLNVIKDCSLLPTWMTSLGRHGLRTGMRPMPGPGRIPGTSSTSTTQGSSRQPSSSGSAAGSSSTNLTPSTSSQKATSQSSSSTSTTAGQGSDAAGSQSSVSSQGSSALVGSQPQHTAPSTGGSAPIHGSGNGSTTGSVRPTHQSSRPHPQQQQQQQHIRPHPHSSSSGNNTAHQRPTPVAASQSAGLQPASNRPPSRHSQGPGHPSGARISSQQPPPHHPGHSIPPPHSSHPHQPVRSHDSARLRGPHDPQRPQEQSRPQDPNRQTQHPRSADHRRSDPSMEGRRSHTQPPQREDPTFGRQQPPFTSNRQPMKSPHTPPIDDTFTPPVAKSPSPSAVRSPNPVDVDTLNVPDYDMELSNSIVQPDDAHDEQTDTHEDLKNSPDKPFPSHERLRVPAPGPKISLTAYRERSSNRSKTVPVPSEQSKDNIASGTSSETLSADTATNSPIDRSLKRTSSSTELASFSVPHDSPNPSNKIKLKRDPTTGERHAVKYTDSGLKIKIRPVRVEALAAEGEAGPSSRSSTPREEGEIVDDTPSPSSGERKSEGGLRIRLNVPKSAEQGSHSRRDADVNGFGSEREHTPHRRSHHHKNHHHQHKNKKHSSKYSSSRHESSKSSKRNSSSMDVVDDRPSKSSRLDVSYSHQDASLGVDHTGLLPSNSTGAVRSLQHQNIGFSINDAFTSTMPNHIFDDSDDEDSSHAYPPVTPTVESNPPHHERFHQLMAQHRARLEAKKPPLPPMPSNIGPPPPPPPPPPSSPPPSPPSL